MPSDLLEKIRAADDVPGLKDADFGLPAGERAREATTRSWNRLVGSWAALEVVRVGAEANDPLVGPTRDRFLLPLFEELGFGRLPVARAMEIEGTSYPISHYWNGRVPIHLVGYGVELDSRTKGVRGAAGAAPHALVQEYLNRTDDALWGVVSNGRTLRLLRDSTSLTRQAYVEFDLEAIFEGELYADFALLWSVLHRSRFEGDKPADCLLERWTKKAADDGTRALDKLRGGVEKAIETLGAGFLATKGNHTLVEALRSGELDSQDYYRELLRLVYRLIFLFTAEDRRDEDTNRELLLDPNAPGEAAERYRRYYSTARLRSLAGRRRGSRHSDLWTSLGRVIAALGSDGAPSLALPALGSFLFGPQACLHLDASDLENEALLDSVRALATIEEVRRLRLVDYRNLGAEELGGIYEGLLELHPTIELDANPPHFVLGTAAGNERKSTGSYYTPSSLINCLLDSALDPVVDEAVRGKTGPEAEAAILGLSVVDPAAGSGHFLIAAAHRLAKRLAAVRSGEGEPPPAQVRHALRDVIARCIYAVDINPMAVELCKVSLWLEALEPGKPLSFLDTHVKCGNSLLGTTPELAADGIPDAAFEAITGDDKAVARAWRARNTRERAGQQALFEAPLAIPTGTLASAIRSLDDLPEDSTSAVAAKALQFNTYEGSGDRRRSKAALDAWCAAFVSPKVVDAPEVTTATVRAMGADLGKASSAARAVVEAAAAEYAFFHWQLEFPAVFERGGFDVVLGNPPWERIKLQEQEFFAARSPIIAAAKNAAERKRRIASLETQDAGLWAAFREALRHSDGESHLLRNSGLFPLTGRGDINTYAVFAELVRKLTATRGRSGVIVPTGIATDDTTKFFFADLVDRQELASLHSFENEEFIFPSVHHAFRFCLLTTSGSALHDSADLVFYARQVTELADPERHFELSSGDFALLNPNTRTCPTFRSSTDAEIAKAIYRRVPVLVDEAQGDAGNPWGVTFMAMFHMANDSGLFLDAPGPDSLPLYEAKMVHQFDHRWATYSGDDVLPFRDEALADADIEITPRYWMEQHRVDARLDGRWASGWLLGWRDITGAEKVRTLIASIIPRAAVGDKFLLMLPSSPCAWLLEANLNSFVADWASRQKVGGTSFKYFVMRQIPVLPPQRYSSTAPWSEEHLGAWLRPRIAELSGTTYLMTPFLRDLGWSGLPFRWDRGRRAAIRAEVDAAYFHLYGVPRDHVMRMLDSFWVVRERDERDHGSFRTLELILDAYDAMAAATPDRPFVSHLDPPPGDARAAHPTGADEPPQEWLPWEDVSGTRSAPAASPARTPLPVSPSRAAVASTGSIPAASSGVLATPALSLAVGADENPAIEWLPETSVEPAAVALGTRVRHRFFGPGTVLAAKNSGASGQLLIRFDTGADKWIALGLALLEFRT